MNRMLSVRRPIRGRGQDNKLQTDIERVPRQTDQTELKAPFNGIVGRRQVMWELCSLTANIATLTNIEKLVNCDSNAMQACCRTD